MVSLGDLKVRSEQSGPRFSSHIAERVKLEDNPGPDRNPLYLSLLGGGVLGSANLCGHRAHIKPLILHQVPVVSMSSGRSSGTWTPNSSICLALGEYVSFAVLCGPCIMGTVVVYIFDLFCASYWAPSVLIVFWSAPRHPQRDISSQIVVWISRDLVPRLFTLS